MPIIQHIDQKIKRIISSWSHLSPIQESKIQIESSKNPHHGDLATNAAMVLCKDFQMAPQIFAQKLKEEIEKFDEVEKVEIAGAGFINITLKPTVWMAELKEILSRGEDYSKIDLGKGQTIHIEFVSANPTGPMHTGHVRNAVLGDAIAALLSKVNYKVYKEYYINDAGGQINCLARSVYLRYLEALGHSLPPHAFQGDIYPGNYLIPLGETLAHRDGDLWVKKEEKEWISEFKTFSVKAMMDLIRHDLEDLGVFMDNYVSEKNLVNAGKIQEALAILEKNGDIYTGILTPPKGKKIEDWEERPQILFRSQKYGDEVDRPLQKSDGEWTYFAGDIAYHLDKYQRGFTRLINVLGADHYGYVTRLKSAVSAVTKGESTLEVKLFQIVNFFENGTPLKMSKRAGNFITSHDVVSRVGKDATRFMMLFRHNSTIIDFDFEKVLELSQENPIFYVHYAHARICSVFRHAKTFYPEIDEFFIKNQKNVKILQDPSEISVIKCLAQWPKIVEQAALHQEPHRITNYLYLLAGELHSLWNQGKESLHLRFIDSENKESTYSKLFLLSGVATVLKDGLKLLGIEPMKEMR